MWTSVRSGASAHAGRVHAALVGDPERHRDPADAPLHLRGAAAAGDRADGGDFGGGGGFRGVDDPAAVRVRGELPGAEVPAGAEQDHGDGVDCGGGAGAAHRVQLAAHAEAPVGARRRCRGAERVVVVHRPCAARLYNGWGLRGGLVWLYLQSLSQSLGLCSSLSCLCCHALVNYLLLFFFFPFLI